MTKHDLKIISYNVRGLNNARKRTAIFDHLRSHMCDIALLQEIYSSEEIENQWAQEWGGKGYFLHGSKHSKGLAILVRRNLDVDILNIEKDKCNRILYLKLKIDENVVHLFNVYAPNKETEQVAFMNSLIAFVSKHNINSADNCVFGGDWNQVLNVDLDKVGGISNVIRQKYLAKLQEFMGLLDVIDIWRMRNGIKKKYTWRQKKPQVKCRLDYFLTSQHMQETITRTDILPSILSDHSPISLSLKFLDTPNIGSGHWKLNVSLLSETEYKDSMRNKLTDIMQMYSKLDDYNLQWELIKYEIRKFTIAYSKERKRNRNNLKITKEKELEKMLNEEFSDNESTQKRIETLKTELEEIYLQEAEGAIIRSRIQWYEQGEKSTSYFFNLEKQRALNKNVKKLMINNSEITNQKHILNKLAEFYEKLYKQSDTDLDCEHEFLTQNSIPKLNDIEQQSCEGPITIQECELILSKFKKNKSPGNDGIPIEFYLEFWKEIGSTLINSYNYSFEHGKLTTSQRQAVISLISKPGKDKLYIENWRPISLLNIDYKIMSKCLANRLLKVIDKLVHHSQFGFIKGRNINDAIRTILDIVDHSDIENKHGILLALDFQKAFDTLSWDYLFKTLELYNFGMEYQRWVKLCYTEISSCVTNYKHASAYFDVKRGVRQGDSLSPYLFILSLELLSRMIREDKSIKGMTYGDNEIKLITFADDTTAFLSDTNDAKQMFKHIQGFEKLSGLKLNKSKSEAFWLGINKNSNFRPLGVSWKTCIKILGIHISYNKDEMERLNYTTKLTKIKQRLNIWKNRDLTIFGKILLIKSYALSQILYTTSVLPTSDKFISELEDIIYNFLWNGKQHKVKKCVIIQKCVNGGQNMISLHDMIKVQKLKWIQKYSDHKPSYWKFTMGCIMKIHRLDIFLQSNFDIPKHISEFYKAVLQSWKDIQNHNIRSIEDIKQQYIWYNRFLQFKPNKTQMYNYINMGIHKVENLIKPNGRFKSMHELNREYNIDNNSFLFHQSIINAIPKEWKTILNGNEIEGNSGSIKYDINTVNCKQVYEDLVIKKLDVSKANVKYSAMFDITEEQWQAYYVLCKKIKVSNKAKEIQYKILHDYVATNKLLYKINVRDSPRCNFCELYSQDTCHLFVECMEVKNFWFDIREWLQSEYNETLSLGIQDILFGKVDVCDFHNKIYMYGKLFIFKCKYKNSIPCCNIFQSWLSKVIYF